jgi:hypothetical protein
MSSHDMNSDDEVFDRLIQNLEADLANEIMADEAVADEAVAVAVPESKEVKIFEFGCNGYGPPWRGLQIFTDQDARALLNGTNNDGRQTKLLCRATTMVSGVTYTLVVFGSRAIAAAERGDLSTKDFRALISKYRGSASATSEKFVVRQDIRGVPTSFQQGNDPFTAAFNLG